MKTNRAGKKSCQRMVWALKRFSNPLLSALFTHFSASLHRLPAFVLPLLCTFRAANKRLANHEMQSAGKRRGKAAVGKQSIDWCCKTCRLTSVSDEYRCRRKRKYFLTRKIWFSFYSNSKTAKIIEKIRCFSLEDTNMSKMRITWVRSNVFDQLSSKVDGLR